MQTAQVGKKGNRKIPVDVRRESVQEAVQRAVDKAGGQYEKAAKELERLAHSDPLLRDAILTPWLDQACWALIRSHAQRERRSIWSPPQADANGHGERVLNLAQSTMTGLLSLTLPLDKFVRLGDANKEQVERAAHYYTTVSKDMSLKGQFLSLVARQLSLTALVKEKFTESKLQKLHQQVVGGV